MDLQDRAIIVTGGASGIGRATARLLARQGAKVLIGDVDAQGGRSTAAEGAVNGFAIDYLPLDLTVKASVDGFVVAVHQQAGRVDGLVNAAGWDQIQPFLENPPEMWDRVIAVNLMGAIRLTRAIPFRRIAQPIEIAQAVLFFLSARSDYVTGQVLSVSGGLTMAD